jgi:hypothetical protein
MIQFTPSITAAGPAPAVELDTAQLDQIIGVKTFALTPVGLGSPLDGVLQPISDPQ